MNNALSFLHTPGPGNPPEVQTLLGYKNTLEKMRHTFLFEVDLRTIKKADIDMLEKDLRDIIGGVERLRSLFHIDRYLHSVDGLQTNIRSAIRHMYLASDILEQRSTAKSRELFYQHLDNCEHCLLTAIKLFAI